MKARIIQKSELQKMYLSPLQVTEYLSKKNNDKLSLALIELDGKNNKVKNEISDAFYFVIEGKGEFFIDEKLYDVKPGDLVCIPKNTPYYDKGKLKMISVCLPPFDRKKTKVIE